MLFGLVFGEVLKGWELEGRKGEEYGFLLSLGINGHVICMYENDTTSRVCDYSWEPAAWVRSA